MGLADFLSTARLARIVLLLTLGLLAIYAEAAPLGLGATALPSPDLLLCVVAYWAIRRPGSTPVLVVFALGLIRDLLTDVPVGAGALSLVILVEVLKSQRLILARSRFWLEWGVVALGAFGTATLQWMLVVLTLAQPPYLVPVGQQILYTAAIYPAIVLLLRWVFRISWRRREAVA